MSGGLRPVAVNGARRPERVPRPPGDEVAQLHRSLPGYRHSPLRSLDGVAAELGLGAVLLKDESERFGLPAFKILGASWAVERLLAGRPAGATSPPVLVAASAGNHGRAVARAAAQRGLGCRIYLPAVTSRTRADLIAQEGAQVVRVDGAYEDAVESAERDATATGALLVADTSARATDPDPSPGWVVEGYSTLFREAAEQAGCPPILPQVSRDGRSFDVVLVPAGVGSLTAAAVRWAVHEQGDVPVVAVEPTGAACVTVSLAAGRPSEVTRTGTTMAGLDCAIPSAAAWPTLRHGLAGAIAVTDEEAHAAMRELADLGLEIGDCGAATLAALRVLMTADGCAPLRAALGLSAGARILCIATEGASDPDAYRAIVSPGSAP